MKRKSISLVFFKVGCCILDFCQLLQHIINHKELIVDYKTSPERLVGKKNSGDPIRIYL